ncbi:MAG: VOC family protein [Acetobacteraceae bacterium]|nr:VOC family protein [Acetobacteraceae bacterium]MDW8399305.1 VOC family protein [Acetobacteraceae bacterium]
MSLLACDINLFCRDPERLMAFYAALLGLPENAAARSPIYRALRFGEVELGFNRTDAYALLGIAERQPAAPATTAYATFVLGTEAEVEALAARVVELGGSVIKPPYRSYYGAFQVVAVDPEGNVFRLNHRG